MHADVHCSKIHDSNDMKLVTLTNSWSDSNVWPGQRTRLYEKCSFLNNFLVSMLFSPLNLSMSLITWNVKFKKPPIWPCLFFAAPTHALYPPATPGSFPVHRHNTYINLIEILLTLFPWLRISPLLFQKQWFSNVSVPQNFLEGLLKYNLLGSISECLI